MKTKEDITYIMAGYTRAIIPKGTKVIPDTNLPDPTQYWAENWENMTEMEHSWQRNYGFLLQEDDVEFEKVTYLVYSGKVNGEICKVVELVKDNDDKPKLHWLVDRSTLEPHLSLYNAFGVRNSVAELEDAFEAI